MNAEFWRNKRVLLTGHTGFKGSWLALLLHRMGARVTGIALSPNTVPSLYGLGRLGELIDSVICDVRDATAVQSIVDHADPEIVLHLAAQPLVLEGYRRPLETFATNVQGTVNVLNALRTQDNVRVVLIVTTDKVYQNLEHGQPYCEEDRLGGRDPYSASKAAAELVVSCWRDSFLAEREIGVASVRAGNVMGGGDWSADRLIPDAVRAWLSGDVLRVRRPEAVRPWQHVLDPLAGYLRLAECLWYDKTLAGAYNFGPPAHAAMTVRHVVSLARQVFGRGDVEWGDGVMGPHEAGLLTLNTAKTQSTLGIFPRWDLATSVRRTLEWYRRHFEGMSVRQLCEEDIVAFLQSVPLAGERAA